MITIRPATAADAHLLPAIEHRSAALFRDWPGLEWIAEDDIQSADEHRRLIEDGVALVAENAAGIVGFANGEFTDADFHVWQMAVDHLWQSQGIGRRLMLALRETAIEHGAEAITLTTFRNVPWNEPFYHRLGFRTLENEALNPRLADVLERERQAGLPLEQRCAMELVIG